MHASVKTKALSGSFRSLGRVFVTDAMHVKLFYQFILVCSLIPTGVAAQSFAPFEPGSRKLFGSTQGFTQAYEIAFDSTIVDGGITTYHNFKALHDSLMPSDCGWNECQQQSKPTWIGGRIERDDQGAHKFFTAFSDTLTLHFSDVPESETLIYQDLSQRFFLSFDGEFTSEVLGMPELVRRWTVVHEDIDGEMISSVLSNAKVEVGESIGLVRFFRIDSFPAVLEPVELWGQVQPALGLYQITEASLHDYQPGDEIQKHIYGYNYSGPIPQNSNSYSKVKILSREDTPMSVTYGLETSTFSAGSSSESVQTSSITYSKTQVLAAIPFTRFYGTQPTLRMEEYCGTPLLTYFVINGLGASMSYCPEEDCWWNGSWGGPWPYEYVTMVPGVGVFRHYDYLSGSNGYSMNRNVEYFIKNGIPCGTEAIVGIDEHAVANTSLLFAPNPANDRVQVIGLEDAIHAELYNASGRLVIDRALTNSNWLELGDLNSGLYLMRVTTRSGVLRTGRLMIER